MELKISESKNRLEIDIIGEDHTLSSILREVLERDPEIMYSSYNMSHPYVSSPRIILETKKQKPKKALFNALNTIKELNAEFLEQFSKEMSK